MSVDSEENTQMWQENGGNIAGIWQKAMLQWVFSKLARVFVVSGRLADVFFLIAQIKLWR